MNWEEKLKGMKEDQFRTNILMPLFRAMGYQGVDHYHGPNEHGKDITMWMPTPTGGRDNYAVVVKAGKINARPSGKGSAAEVVSQIQQCFGDTYTEETRGEEFEIHKVFVAASGTIKSDTRKAIRRILKNHSLERNVEYLPLDRIVTLLQKHFPAIGAIGLFDQAHAVMSSANPELDLSVSIVPGGRAISAKPKDPDKPYDVTFNFHSDSDEVAKELHDALKQFDSQGGTLSVPSTVKIQSNLTEFLESIGIGPSPSLTNLKFIEQPRDVGLFTLRRVENDGTITELNHINFAVVESGKTTSKIQSKLETESAYQLELVINRETKEVHYHLSPRFLESNAVAAYRTAAFALALSKPGTLDLIQDSTGIRVLEGGEGISKLTFDPILVTILQRLAAIQEKTGVLLAPKPEYSADDLADIARTYIIVTEGRLVLQSLQFTTSAGEVGSFSDIPDQIVFPRERDDFTISLFGAAIDLGPSEIVAPKAVVKIEPDSNLKPGETKLAIHPEPDTEIFVNFPRFSKRVYFRKQGE